MLTIAGNTLVLCLPLSPDQFISDHAKKLVRKGALLRFYPFKITSIKPTTNAAFKIIDGSRKYWIRDVGTRHLSSQTHSGKHTALHKCQH